jgi:sugar-phosphatase
VPLRTETLFHSVFWPLPEAAVCTECALRLTVSSPRLPEARALEQEELTAREGIIAVGGASQLLRRLKEHQWAVVTSASRALATVRLECAGLPVPPLLISADDVSRGKPDPEGYLKAADGLGVPNDHCVVVEDTPAGILAGRKAGMTVLALSTTFAPDHLLGALCVPDFKEVQFSLP